MRPCTLDERSLSIGRVKRTGAIMGEAGPGAICTFTAVTLSIHNLAPPSGAERNQGNEKLHPKNNRYTILVNAAKPLDVYMR